MWKEKYTEELVKLYLIRFGLAQDYVESRAKFDVCRSGETVDYPCVPGS